MRRWPVVVKIQKRPQPEPAEKFSGVEAIVLVQVQPHELGQRNLETKRCAIVSFCNHEIYQCFSYGAPSLSTNQGSPHSSGMCGVNTCSSSRESKSGILIDSRIIESSFPSSFPLISSNPRAAAGRRRPQHFLCCQKQIPRFVREPAVDSCGQCPPLRDPSTTDATRKSLAPRIKLTASGVRRLEPSRK